jgi:hypothetical protein
MVFLTNPMITSEEMLLVNERVAIVEPYDKKAKRELRPTVVPMRTVVPSLKKKLREEISELDRNFSW